MGCVQPQAKRVVDVQSLLLSSRTIRRSTASLEKEPEDNDDAISVSSNFWETAQENSRIPENYQEIVNKMSNNDESPPGAVSINGFVNHRNTCFINAVLQCIVRMQPLVEYFISQIQTKEILRDITPNDRDFMKQIANLIVGYHTNNDKTLSIKHFCISIEKVFPGYKIGNQEDAQEFLCFLFDKIHSSLNRAKADSSRIELYNKHRRVSLLNNRPDQQPDINDQATQAWYKYLTLDKSVMIGKLIRHFSGTGFPKI
jgi:ubiquitin C-terminal hydrolase